MNFQTACKKSLATAFLLLAFCQFATANTLFIAQAPSKDPEKITPDLASAFAEVCPDIISLNPMVWSLTDPSYRDAYYAGKFSQDPTKIDLPGALSAAKEIGSPYLLWIEVEANKNGIKGDVQLFDSGNGKKVFAKSYQIGADSGGSSDILAAMSSTARLALFNMCEKSLKPWQKSVTTVTDPGVKPPLPTDITPIGPDEPILNDPNLELKILEIIEEKIAAGERDSAMLLLYEAIDSNPKSVGLRRKLIQMLAGNQNSAQLIEECRNTLLIDPMATETRIFLVRALLLGGDILNAQLEMNELLARDPNNPEVTVLQGDFYLETGEIGKARTLYLIAKQKQPSLQIDLAIMMVAALDGDVKETGFLLKNSDLNLIAENDLLLNWLARYSKQGIERTCAGLQELLRNIRVGKLTNQSTRTASNLSRISDSLDLLVSSVEPKNSKLKKIHEQRVLAHKLLAQATKLVEDALPNRDEDKCLDAEFTIGECLSLIRSL